MDIGTDRVYQACLSLYEERNVSARTVKVLRALPDIDIYELIRKAEECMEQLLQVGVITHHTGCAEK